MTSALIWVSAGAGVVLALLLAAYLVLLAARKP